MNVLELLGVYVVAGLACAVAVHRRGGGFGSVVATVLVWPLWAPVALTDRDASPSPLAAQIAARLDEARQAAAGSPFETMLHAEAAARILREVEAAAHRLAELDATLAQPSFDRPAVVARLAELTAEGAGEATLRPARLHLESVDRLCALRARQRAALDELEQVLCALRSQLVVARYAGPEHDGVDGILGDLWSRVEGLGEVLDDEEPIAAQVAPVIPVHGGRARPDRERRPERAAG